MHALLNDGVVAAGCARPVYAHPAIRAAAVVPQSSAAVLPAQASLMPDADFYALQVAYMAHGGLAHGDELAQRLHVDGAGGYAHLARWIVGRKAFSFSWHAHFWLPMFQFDAAVLTPCQGLRPVLSELADEMDGWALATWFSQPNDSLQGRSPVSMWPEHGPEVHQAARLQRFVLKG